MNKKIKLLPYTEEHIYGLSPNDSQFIGWELDILNVVSQWNYSQGENVVVAVLDSGCDLDHLDLKDNLVDGKNFVDKNSPPIDRCGHGTHVAGTIAASNNGKGMVGVAPKAKIMPVKCLGDDGSGMDSWIIDSIYWAVDNGADIITMSLGSSVYSKVFENAINYAAKKNCGIFCAAGNSGENVDIMYPAKYNNTVSIGAIDKTMNRTSFTCSGETLDFLAPGHDIISCYPNNSYATMSGTSMSNPFVAGCAALLCSYMKNRNIILNYDKYIERLKIGSIHLSNPVYAYNKKYEGYGIINPDDFKSWIQ